MVHHFKGKLLLPDEPAAEQQPESALLNMSRIDGTMEKYLSPQVSDGSCDHRSGAVFFVMTLLPACINQKPDFYKMLLN